MPLFSSALIRRRFASELLAALTLALGLVSVAAQQPTVGPNVNLAGGPLHLRISPFEILGDPLRAQQFEGSCVFSTRNPLRVFCVSNDHRVVDIDGIDAAVDAKQIIGDSTIGVFLSSTGGLKWQSRIIPGSKYDDVPSPIKAFEALADPFAGAGAAGVIFSSGIAFNRGDNPRGVVFVTTWMDLGDKEDDVFWARPITTRIVDEGSSGQFIDRPSMLVAPPQGAMVTYNVPRDDGTFVQQTVPASPVHIAYTTFVGNDLNIRSKIMYTASYDGGMTWLSPAKVSEGYAINQGVQIAQAAGKICLTWRRGEAKGVNNETDAIMVACSTDEGKTFAKASVLSNLCAADQDTSFTRFRIRAVPAITADGPRFHVVWSDRPRDASGACSNLDARIYGSHSTDGGGWATPGQIAPSALGNQVNPAIAVSSGQIEVMWYDFRHDASGVFATLDELPIVENFLGVPQPRKRHTVDVYATHKAVGAAQWAAPYPVSKYIFGEIKDPADLAKLPAGAPTRQQLQWNPVNVRLFKKLTVPGLGDYNSVTMEAIAPADPVGQPGVWTRATGQLGDPYVFYSWTDNRNIKLLPNEDYSKPRPFTPPELPLDVAEGGMSVFDPTKTRVFPCVAGLGGTKNQDVFGALKTGGVFAGAFGNNKSTENIPRAFGVFGQNTTADPKILRFAVGVQPPGGADQMATFNQRIPALPFMAQTTVDAGAPSGSAVVRTVYVPRQPRSPIRIDVSEAAAATPAIVSDNGVATATLPKHGFATSDRIIIVGADQPVFNGIHTITATGADTFTFPVGPAAPPVATGSILAGAEARLRLARKVWLNFDPSAPATLDLPDSVPENFPDLDINNFEVYGVEIGQSTVQDISFPSVKTPGWETPGWETPGWETPGWETPGWETPGWETPGWETPGWETPGWETPGWETSTIDEDDVENGSVKDLRFPVTNTSNSPVAVNLRALFNGTVPDFLKFQAVAYRLYTTPAQESCGQTLTGHTQVIFNIQSLDVSQSNFNAPLDSPSPQNGTALLFPGETIYFNVRVWDTTNRLEGRPHALDPADVIAKAVRQPLGTQEIIDGITESPEEVSLAILTKALPTGIVGTSYGAELQPTGGMSGDYTWAITGGSLPAGLTLSQTGLISGSPTVVGTFPIQVTVSDSRMPLPLTASRPLTISILPNANLTGINTLEDTPHTTVPGNGGGSPITFNAITAPTHGTLSGSNPITYTPALNYSGPDSFVYSLTAGGLTSAPSTVAVAVAPVNDAPVAVDDSAVTSQDVPLVLTQGDLKDNDTDVDNTNADLSVAAVSNATNGTVVRNPDTGSVTFTPTGAFNGLAGFDYTVSDGELTDLGHVTVTVDPIPFSFKGTGDFTVGSSPEGIAAGNLDGDLNADVVTANFSSSNISVLLGTGTASFGAATNYATGGGPRDVTLGDLDGDGDLDIAVAQLGGNLSVALNQGPTSPGKFVMSIVTAPGQNNRVAIADVNGDTKKDIVVAKNGDVSQNNVGVLLGNGNGTFQSEQLFSAGTYAWSIGVEDLNGDGRQDLIVSNRDSRDVSVLLGNADSLFAAAVSHPALPSSSTANVFDLSIDDLNGDDIPDVVVGTNSGFISILRGNDDGSLSAPTIITHTSFARPTKVLPVDVDRNGDVDLAVMNFDGVMSVFRGLGAGSFEHAIDVSTGSSSPSAIADDDFDNDGRPDLVFARKLGTAISILRNTTPSF